MHIVHTMYVYVHYMTFILHVLYNVRMYIHITCVYMYMTYVHVHVHVYIHINVHGHQKIFEDSQQL